MNEMMLIAIIDDRRTAIPATHVLSIVEIERIVAVPMAPPHIAGLAAMRSQALTVICCRSALGSQPVPFTPGDRAVVIRVDGHQYALLVDEVEGVVLATSQPEPIKGGFGSVWDNIAIGKIETGGEPALLIDHAQLVKGQHALAA